MIDMDTVTVSPKFRVVIPLAVRQRLKLQAGTKLTAVDFNGGPRLMPLRSAAELRGITGVIVRVNQRTATIGAGPGGTCRLPFHMLRHVLDI
jgi:AbrB family looped-hinge helix DNA binding protein